MKTLLPCILLVALFTAGCDEKPTPLDGSAVFGLQLHGGGLPHASSYVSLVRNTHGGRPTSVWPAISFRCQSPVAWRDNALFGAVTEHSQSESGRVRLLHVSPLGIADITQELGRHLGIGGTLDPSLIDLKRNGSVIEIRVHAGSTVEAKLTLDEVTALSEKTRKAGRIRVFDGVAFAE